MNRAIRRTCRTALLCAAGLAAASVPALAQDLQVKAPANLAVYLVNDDGRRMVGTVNGDGQLEIPGRLGNRDTEYEVVLENGPATNRSVALVERGKTDEFCQDESPPGSPFRYTGTINRWGQMQRLSISDAGEVTVEGASANDDDDDGLDWGVGWLIDADAARAFLNDSDRICSEAQALVNGVAVGFTCNNDSDVNAWSADAGLTFARFIALKVGYLELGRINFDLSGSVDSNAATVSGHFGRVHGATFTGEFRVDVGPVVPFVEAGAWRWSADTGATISVTGGTPISIATSRTITGWNPVVGAGIEIWPTRHVGLSAGVRWIPISEDISGVEDLVKLDNSFKMVFVGLKLGGR
jgi:hypothetical protein